MSSRLNRRAALSLLGNAALAASVHPVIAQGSTTTPLIGWVSSRAERESAVVLKSFRDGLRESGLVEGRNVDITYLWADSQYDRLPALCTQLVDRKVNVIFAAGGPPTAAAAKAATKQIPIVFIANSPVELGIVESLARPGGNLTGIGLLTPELVKKQLQYLREALPEARKFAYLENPKSPAASITEAAVRDAAQALGIKVDFLYASTEPEIDAVFEGFGKLGAAGLAVHGEPYFDSHREQIIALATRYSVRGCYPWREYATLGGLMSYGSNLPHAYRQAAIYVSRIVKGEKPSELPIQQPEKFEFVINLKAAKQISFTVPPELLARANQVMK